MRAWRCGGAILTYSCNLGILACFTWNIAQRRYRGLTVQDRSLPYEADDNGPAGALSASPLLAGRACQSRRDRSASTSARIGRLAAAQAKLPVGRIESPTARYASCFLALLQHASAVHEIGYDRAQLTILCVGSAPTGVEHQIPS